jgi:hypothetical protein
MAAAAFYVCCAIVGAFCGALGGALVGGCVGGLVSLPLIPFTLGLALPILSSIGAMCGCAAGAITLGTAAISGAVLSATEDGAARPWLKHWTRRLGAAAGGVARVTAERSGL